MRYYAAENPAGFANSWAVLVFCSKAARDEFVSKATCHRTKAVKKREATRYASNWSLTENRSISPKPFTDEYWGIVNYGDRNISGFIGTVEVCNPCQWYPPPERLY